MLLQSTVLLVEQADVTQLKSLLPHVSSIGRVRRPNLLLILKLAFIWAALKVQNAARARASVAAALDSRRTRPARVGDICSARLLLIIHPFSLSVRVVTFLLGPLRLTGQVPTSCSMLSNRGQHAALQLPFIIRRMTMVTPLRLTMPRAVATHVPDVPQKMEVQMSPTVVVSTRTTTL